MSTATETRALPQGTWQADPVHSEIAFAIDYMAGTFHGGFSKFEARVVDGELSGSAEVASVQVKDPGLEAHLQSPEFFDAQRHPTLGFRSTEIRGEGDGLEIAGEVTIKGHTEPVEIRGAASEPIADPFGNERFGLRLETSVDRTKFGVSWNNPLPSGEPALSDQVRLAVELQLVKAGE